MDPTHLRALGGGKETSAALLAAPPRTPRPTSEWQRLRPGLPQRYRTRPGEGSADGFLVCDEAPRVQARIRRDYSFSQSAARELGERVILLDGAGSFGPLLDNKRRLYNLDHHQGCERTFTLATCEQALLMVSSGLDLSEGDWTIYANEPDLDTLLALWILLNHARVRTLSPQARDVLLPMIRLEGAIDANGNELADVCGLPERVRADARSRLDGLLARERDVKGGGTWQTLDLQIYCLEMLAEIDKLVYRPEDFHGYSSVGEVYGHIEIGERSVAVVCHDGAGIYQVEKLLKERWGEQLALIALGKEPGHYTLRRVSTLADLDLNDGYRRLNQLDRNVDGRPPGKRWGGSDSIGGSPRPTGSALSPTELLDVLAEAFRQPTGRQRFWAVVRVAMLVAGLGLFGGFAGLGASALAEAGGPLALPVGSAFSPVALGLVAGALFVASLSLLLAWLFSGRRLWLYGWRRPVRADWLPLAVVAAAAALPLRAWFPTPASLEPAILATALAVVVCSALALEACFRGLTHGLIQLDADVQTPGGRWHLSRATWVSAGLYALAAAAFSLPDPGLGLAPHVDAMGEVAVVTASTGLAGLALGAIRERSLSLWPGFVAQLVGALACAAFWFSLAP
jgi:hypothetical protein